MCSVGKFTLLAEMVCPDMIHGTLRTTDLTHLLLSAYTRSACWSIARETGQRACQHLQGEYRSSQFIILTQRYCLMWKRAFGRVIALEFDPHRLAEIFTRSAFVPTYYQAPSTKHQDDKACTSRGMLLSSITCGIRGPRREDLERVSRDSNLKS